MMFRIPNKFVTPALRSQLKDLQNYKSNGFVQAVEIVITLGGNERRIPAQWLMEVELPKHEPETLGDVAKTSAHNAINAITRMGTDFGKPQP